MSLLAPLAIMIYVPEWYFFNCHFHTRCERYGMPGIEHHVHNLVNYFLHLDKFHGRWTGKEISHLSEVRAIYDKLFLTVPVWIALFAWSFNWARLKRAAMISLMIVASFLLVLPFFAYFWMDVFHPLLFNNMNWKNNRFDVSFWIMPREFFRNSVIFMVVVSTGLSGTAWYWAHRKTAQGPKDATDSATQ